MARPISKNLVDKINDRIVATNYKKAQNALTKSNFSKYVPIATDEEVLALSLKPEISNLKNKKNAHKFLKTISDIMQSMTTKGFTTYEIVSFIAARLDSFGADKAKVIEFLEKSYTIVHTDYSKHLSTKKLRNVERILFNHYKEEEYGAYTDIGFRLIGTNIAVNRDIKTLCMSKTDNIIQKVSQATVNPVIPAQVNTLFNSYYKGININKNIKNPTKSNPSFSSIMITNPDVKIGSRNSLELATFFNSVSNIEFDRAYPFFNAEFIIPNYSKQDVNAVMKAASINQFIHGSLPSNKTTSNYKMFEGDNIKRDGLGQDEKVIKTNMSLFTAPQTMNNLDEDTGHSSNMSNKSLRLTSIKDSTQPFMTLKNLSINVSPTKGLMSFKTGKLSLALHDRSRLPDIAPFVKHDLFGAFGAEIILEYGWSHLDEDNPELNPLGAFLGNSKVKEVYMITNSSFSMEQSGMINIDLSISMKGASLLKNTEISFVASNRVKEAALKTLLATITSCRMSLGLESDVSIHSRFSQTDILNPVNSISPEVVQEIIDFRVNCFFLKNQDLATCFDIEEISNLGEKPKYVVNISQTNSLVDKEELFLKLIFGSKLNDFKNKEERTIITDESKEVVRALITKILESYSELHSLSYDILQQDVQEEEQEAAILETIVGGIDFIDPFYPVTKGFYKEVNKGQQAAAYVSFGSVVSSLLQTHVVNKTPCDFDEVQTIFYTANSFAAGMKSNNLSTFLIPKEDLKTFIKKEIKKELQDNNSKGSRGVTVVTIESIISQIINKFIVTKNSVNYGLSELYKTDENNSVVAVNDDQKVQAQSLSRKLHKIYYPDKTFDAQNDCTFKVPSIRFSFDCVTSLGRTDSDNAKTILRISIYDENDSPYDSISNILEKLYLDDYKKSIDSIIRIKTKYQSLGSKSLYEEKIKEELKFLKEKKYIIEKGNGFVFNPLVKIKKAKNETIKSFYKRLFPSMTFGTQHTSMLSANVSTVNDNKLNTVYITRADRNNQSEINSRITTDLPLRVMPTQASVETFGCPWINFGQFIFLDFDTGTTIDNKYAVTGITHNFSPGKFSTSLTLSYGDVYGQFEQNADLLETVTPQLNVKKKSQSNKTQNPNDNKTTSLDGIEIFGTEYRKSKYFKSGLGMSDQSIEKNYKNPQTVEYESVIHSNFIDNPVSLLFFENSYSNKVTKADYFIDSLYNQFKLNLVTSRNNILSTFKDQFLVDRMHKLKLYVSKAPDSNTLPFMFNSQVSSIKKSASGSGSYKEKRLIIEQKDTDVTLQIKNPNLMFREKSEVIDLNKINTNLIKNTIRSLEDKAKKEKDNKNYKALVENNNVMFNALYEHLLQAYIKQGENFFTLKTRMLTLKDFVDPKFTQNLKDKNDDAWFFHSDINNKLSESEDFLRTRDKNKIIKMRAYTQYGSKPVYEKISAITKDLDKKTLEINAAKAKRLIKNDMRLSIIKSYNVIKSFKVGFETDIEVTTTQDESIKKGSVLQSQKGLRYYDLELNKEIVEAIKNETTITDIFIRHNKTPDAKIVIILDENDISKDFVEYDESTSRNINLIDPDFTVTTIFDKNYFGRGQRLPGYQFNDAKNEYIDDANSGNEPTLGKANIKTYEVNLEEFYIDINEKIKEFLADTNSDKKGEFTLYTHNTTKKDTLGNDILDKDSKLLQKEILKIEKSNQYDFNTTFASFTDNMTSFTGKGNISSSLDWDVNTDDPDKVHSVPAIIEASDNEYRGIKKNNLPVANQKLSKLIVMEEYIPPSSSNSGPLAAEDGFGVASPFDYNNLEKIFKETAKDISAARELYKKQFPLDTFRGYINFKSTHDKANQNKPYSQLKVSDLTIQKSTPDSKTIMNFDANQQNSTGAKVQGAKKTNAKITYRKSIVNNKATIEKTSQRRTKIQPALFYMFELAAAITLKQFPGVFDEVNIHSGGDIPLYLTTQRTLSLTIRHDSGFAADVMLKKGNKPLRLSADGQVKNNQNKRKENEIIYYFLKTCKELGATGIGADHDYEGGKAFHVDIAAKNKDISSGNYDSKNISITYKGKQEVITQAQLRRKIKTTQSGRYWGKDDAGKFTKHGAPKALAIIFK